MTEKFLEENLGMTDAIGQQFGSYRLLRLLGTGNFAAVYLGEHQYLERPAAIKVLHVRMDQEADAAFRREARTIAHLDHPHIVRVLDFGIQGQTPYLVMEYTPNGTLRTLHPKGSCLFCEQIVQYVRQIASALDYAHRQGVIHRDVKPENLLVNARGDVLLSDFGIAVVEHTLGTLSRAKLAGTPLYMAPEQIWRRPCPASDQYALGVMVYEWLAGQPPFPGPGLAVFGQHLHQPPPSLRAHLPHLPPTVEAAVFRALAKDPAQRFACVTDFATALEEACSATQPLAPRSGTDSLPQEFDGPTRPLSDASGSPLVARYAVQPTSALTEQPRFVAPQRLSPVPAPLQRQNRIRLLRRVHAFWIEGVLEHSLHGAALMTLGLQTQPDIVANPWHLVLQQPEATPHLLPAGTRITDVYDAADGELLILGAPGAGKTTLLLELARDLLKRAEQDEQHPLPVVFNLSSWASKQQPLLDWLAEELVTKYQIPRKLARALLSDDQILPLLDGLDEVAPAARTACIEAINTYRQEHGFLPLVACSRQADYLSQTVRVLVRSAVLVQPLTQEQVDAYLEQGGRSLWALRAALHQDATLRDLTSTPLMLSILTLTYHGKPVEELLRGTSLEERQRRIFEQYVGRTLTRRGPLQTGTPRQVVKWLAFLAARMRERNQTVFYLEQLQPDWLTARDLRTYIWTGIRVPAIMLGILTALLVMAYFNGTLDLVQLLTPAVLGGFLGWLWSLSFTQRSALASRMQVPDTMWKKRLIVSLGTGLLVSFDFAHSFDAWLAYGLSSATFIGIGSLCLQHLFIIPTKRSFKQPGLSPLPFLHSVYVPRALLVAAVYGLSTGLSLGLAYWLYSGQRLSIALFYGIYYGLYYGMVLGLVSLLIGLIIPAQADTVRLTERVRWTWSSLKKSLSTPRHLRATFFLTCAVFIFAGLFYALFYASNGLASKGLNIDVNIGLLGGLSGGLSVGLSYWLLVGLIRGFAQERVEDQERHMVNQGIQQSWRNSMPLGLISAGLMGLVGSLSITMGSSLARVLLNGITFDDISRALSYWPNGLLVGISGGGMMWFLSGGMAVLRHGILRWLLRRSGVFPRHYVRFLDEAASCILLQKIGGGYSFVHRLLLEYFASLDSTPSTDFVSFLANPGESRSRSSWLTLFSTLPTSPLPQGQIEPRPEPRSFLRREVVIELIGIGGMLALGGVGWLLEQRRTQLPTEAHNLDFTQGTTGWFLSGAAPQDYTWGIDPTVRHVGKPAAYLRARVARPTGSGALIQAFQGIAYRGKRLRLSGYVKAQAVEQWAGLGMRVDGGSPRHVLSYDDMFRRPIRGTVDWKRYEIVLDVPLESTDIVFGIVLDGKGQIWFSEMQFQVVGKEVPTTGG